MRSSRRRPALCRFILGQTFCSRLLMVAAMCVIAVAPSPGVLHAANFSWTGPGGNPTNPTSGNWNVAGNWVGGLPPTNDITTALDFGGSSSTPYTSTHNLGQMQVNILTFSSSAPVAETITAAPGSSLQLVGGFFADPTITQNSSGAFVVNVPMTLANNVLFSTAFGVTDAGSITLGGNLTGTGNLTHTSESAMLILSGDNSGYSGNIIVAPPSGFDNATRAVAVLSARSPNALGTGNLHLLGSTAVGTPAFATAILEIGADLDGPGNASDFSRGLGTGPGQINMTGPDEKAAFGFAARGAPRVVNIGGNATPTALVHKQPLLQFGDADGYSLGSRTADNTLVFMNPIDFLDNANRNLRTIRGVGNVPEGRIQGSLLNSVNNNTFNISGTGGVILDNVSTNSWQQGTVPNPVIVSGGVFLAVSDPASPNANSPLGRNTNGITIGSDTGGNSGFGTPLGDINTGVMTYGPGTSGASPTPIIDIARNFTIGTGGSGIMTVGGFTADHTRFSGNIDLNGVNTRFTARTGGRVEFSGVVSDSGLLTIGDTIIEGNSTIPGIHVEGRGVVVLSGDNTYTGGTEVTHGALLVSNTAGSGTGTGAVNVLSGATLGGSGTIVPTDAFGTVTINSGGILAPHITPDGTSALTIGGNGLTLAGGALLNFNIGAPGVSDIVNLTGTSNNLTLSGNSTLNLTNVGGLTVANYPIIRHTGGNVLGGGMINIGTNPGLGFNYALVNTPNQVELRVTSSAPSKTWTGSASNEWSTSAGNFAPSNYANGDQVTFNNTGNPANSNINITAPVSPAFITVDNGGAVPTYTLGGAAITGTAGITKTGTGTLELSGANTFSGVTSVSGGMLRVTNTTGSATGSGLVAIASGATLAGSGTLSPTGDNTLIIGSSARIAPHLTPTTANTLTIGSNGLTLQDGSILDFNFGAVGNHDRVVLAGPDNALTLQGMATLNVNSVAGFGTGTYPVLEFGSREGLGSIVLGTLPAGDLIFNILNNPTNIALAVAATKTWNGAVNATWDTTTANWTLGGSGAAFSNGDAVRFNDTYMGPNRNITVAAPVTVAGITASNSAGNDYTIGGAPIGGPGGVTKSGTGTFSLNNSNAFTGKATITGGTLSIASAASLGAEPAAPTPDAITIDGATLRATGSAAFSANRGVTLGAGGATFNIANAGDVMSIPGAVLGTSAVTVNGDGTLQLGSTNNTFVGVNINDATVELKPPVGQNVVVNANGTTGLLGDSNTPIMIDGGTLRFTTTASSQNITLDRVIQFGPDGGTVDLRNELGGTLGGAVVNGVGGGVGNMRVDLTNTLAPVVVQWNGGETGLSTNNPANGDWSEGNNNLEWQQVTTGAQAPPLRIELSHAGMTTIRAAQFGMYNGPFTIRGGDGGDVTAAGNQVTEIGRVQVSGPAADNLFTFSGGMFLEGALQINLSTTFRVFDNNITLRGDASGHPADILFNGRATGTAFSGNQQTFQLTLGTPDTPNSRTLTIDDGASAHFDVRIRTDQNNSHGVEVPARLDIKAGGTARARQSWFGLSVGATDRPVGYVEVFGDIIGNGDSADGESVFEVQMPFSDRNQPRTSEGGVTFRGGSAQQFEARLIVNGDNSGSGAGLQLRGAPRDTKLYTTNNQQGAAALAFPTDPVSAVTKLSGNPDSIASAGRLAALTGSGGYLTLAAVGETFPFPAGGEWPNNVPVGLKVINSNTLGDDVSLSGGFQHNINVDAGATLNAGGQTIGPASASPNLGLIKGLGTISGNPTFAGGATVAPGFGVGTLATAGNATINGTLQAEINGTAHDQLNSLGNLALGASSVLSLPAGNTYDGSSAVILAAYTGTRTGNFGSTSPLPAGYTLDYGDGSNSFITLRPANPTNEWFRTDAGAWHTAGNWLTGEVPNSNTATARLGSAMLTDGTIDIAGTNTTVKSLRFNNGAASYTVGASGSGRLTVAADTGNASIVFENGNARDHSITAGLTLGSNVDVSVNEGQTLFLRGQQNWGGRSMTVSSGRVRYQPTQAASGTAGATLNIAGPAEVVLAGTAPTSDGTNHVHVINQGRLTLPGGAVPVSAQAVGAISGNGTTAVGEFADAVLGGTTLAVDHVRQSGLSIGNSSAVNTRTSGGTSVLGSLSIFGTPAVPLGVFDLNNNAAVIDYSGDTPVETVRQQILAGRGGPGFGASWSGQGITSSAAAAAVATDPESRSVGYAENSSLPLGPYANFRGQTVDDTSVLMAYTRTGDANLDGIVDDTDVTIIGATYDPTTPQPHWALGDFDYNGFVDDADVTLLGVFYDPIAPPLAAPGSMMATNVAAVPEPTTATMLMMASLAIALAAVRRRRAR